MKFILKVLFYLILVKVFLSFGNIHLFYFWVVIGIFAIVYDFWFTKSRNIY